MTEKEIATFYQTLPKRDKGLFTAYVSVKLGGSPHSWQARFIKMFRGQVVRPLYPPWRFRRVWFVCNEVMVL